MLQTGATGFTVFIALHGLLGASASSYTGIQANRTDLALERSNWCTLSVQTVSRAWVNSLASAAAAGWLPFQGWFLFRSWLPLRGWLPFLLDACPIYKLYYCNTYLGATGTAHVSSVCTLPLKSTCACKVQTFWFIKSSSLLEQLVLCVASQSKTSFVSQWPSVSDS